MGLVQLAPGDQPLHQLLPPGGLPGLDHERLVHQGAGLRAVVERVPGPGLEVEPCASREVAVQAEPAQALAEEPIAKCPILGSAVEILAEEDGEAAVGYHLAQDLV